MTEFFSDEMRRNPYPVYDQLRATSPLFRVPPPFDAWLILDYDSVRKALDDHETFSSAVPGPRNWFIFHDAPRHSQLRALISKAFTPKVVTNLEPRIRALSKQLLTPLAARGQGDLAAEYAVPLPMRVIAEMIGIPGDDWLRYKRWSDTILRLSYSRSGGPEAAEVLNDFIAVTAEMKDYVAAMIAQRTAEPRDDLLTRLVQAEVEGRRLNQEEILGFVQLLVVGGQETTANVINNAILCFLEHPDQFARLKSNPQLLAGAIEEVLRYRAPLQWLMRTPTREVQLHGQTIPARKLVLLMIGSANRDPRQFADPNRFDITRAPNPHVAFGHGTHFCLGAPLTRLEARIALTDLIQNLGDLKLQTDQPWEPRKALHVLGPAHLPITFTPAGSPGSTG